MKKLFFVLILVVLGLFSVLPAQTEQKEFAVEPGKKLDMDLKMGGSISVSGWDQKKILVTIDWKGVERKDFEVEFRQAEGGLAIEGRALSRHVHHSPDFSIRVPRSFDLKLRTMGGEVSIENVSGSIGGRTMGGGLEFKNLKGNIEFTTMGGEITLRDSELDGELKTMGGRVLFENVVGDVKGSSMGGNVVMRNVKPRNGKASGNLVRISTMGGDINVDEALEGADLHTMGGDIRIRSAAKSVKAKTMGGDIGIDAMAGAVSATTMGGEIEVNETGALGSGSNDIELTSMGGDVTLTLPANWDAEVYVEIRLEGRHREEAKIVSDFPLEQTRSDKAKSDDGRHFREYLYGKGKIGGGKNKITIKTINSDVYIKKSR